MMRQVRKCLITLCQDIVVHSCMMRNVCLTQLRAQEKTKLAKLLSVYNPKWLKKMRKEI